MLTERYYSIYITYKEMYYRQKTSYAKREWKENYEAKWNL